ncbi:uncharacterized protein VTP21DRAFT_9125 [Calcarisporiella thermophila]|uniref:uncharacterized protein n=1 Tax=Calcarisporiella thermophila TaxID=911321 RepID=UPI003741F667
MGGVQRYPYPKDVWSPAGGWWTQPKNWRVNTAITAIGMAVIIAGVWKFSADREWRHNEPKRWIPSSMWEKQFRDGEFKRD